MVTLSVGDYADVRISIYSADGKLVWKLDLGQQTIGVYNSKNRAGYWDGCNAIGETATVTSA